VNKREAKREACEIASKLIDSYLDRDWGPNEEFDEAEVEKIDVALRVLSLELLNRGPTKEGSDD